MASQVEVAAMRRALELARTPGVPLGPNPRVGCVLLDARGDIVADAHHRGAGTPHAEVAALAAAGPSARGATAVVTLEPCNHTGRTEPCAQALVEAGVVRVVFAQSDVNPVAQGGTAALEAAGVDVEAGVLADEAAQVNPAWSFAMLHRRPFVTWKYAATLDGRSAAADGTSQWITSLASRRDVHRLRAQCDAIVVGTGTVLADDPWLTVRDENGRPAATQPLRVVVGHSEVPADARVLDSAAETLLLRTRDPHEVLGELFARDRQHVWLEGGPTLAGAFLRAGAVDEVVAYLAPVLLGDGRHALDDAGIQTLAEAVRLDVTDLSRVGADLRVTGRTLPANGDVENVENPMASDKE
ncbi:MAG TPA: bifunctional diaminohydroxyphosphoribosylaminopyrimidine deaminase/5-amino-6-(5-phosphoribosylamino)uracil reductase RibD [Nocardioidaceae bacterium]|nr:bifunctional diaminohydroxyphosphoribosylaminopyrimidine deaminase/5-amino-6-(5-phosphoribosylamino)uracil reductase RibD [Nocardioidaceae bacterium]